MLEPRYDSPNITTRKLLYWVCSETGKCFDVKEDALAGSPKPKVNRLDTEKSLTEILLGEKPYDNQQ